MDRYLPATAEMFAERLKQLRETLTMAHATYGAGHQVVAMLRARIGKVEAERDSIEAAFTSQSAAA